MRVMKIKLLQPRDSVVGKGSGMQWLLCGGDSAQGGGRGYHEAVFIVCQHRTTKRFDIQKLNDDKASTHLRIYDHRLAYIVLNLQL